VSNSVNINWICYYFITLNIAVHQLTYIGLLSWSYFCVQCSACDCANIKT